MLPRQNSTRRPGGVMCCGKSAACYPVAPWQTVWDAIATMGDDFGLPNPGGQRRLASIP